MSGGLEQTITLRLGPYGSSFPQAPASSTPENQSRQSRLARRGPRSQGYAQHRHGDVWEATRLGRQSWAHDPSTLALSWLVGLPGMQGPVLAGIADTAKSLTLGAANDREAQSDLLRTGKGAGGIIAWSGVNQHTKRGKKSTLSTGAGAGNVGQMSGKEASRLHSDLSR